LGQDFDREATSQLDKKIICDFDEVDMPGTAIQIAD